jgi:hypothetical protein
MPSSFAIKVKPGRADKCFIKMRQLNRVLMHYMEVGPGWFSLGPAGLRKNAQEMSAAISKASLV